MTDSPFAPSEVTVTIKYGKGYEESWVVFRGSAGSIRSQLIDYFALTTPWAEEVTLNELVTEATKIAHGVSTVARTLGGKAVAPSESASESTGSAWDKARSRKAEPSAEDKAEEEAAKLRTQIAAADSTDALKRLWAENQDAFKDESLMAEWKARGKALSQ